MKMEQIECSETSAYNNQTPGGNTQKNTYKIQNTAEVWDQVILTSFFVALSVDSELINIGYNIKQVDRNCDQSEGFWHAQG